ncbi:hypothetical protein NVP1111B_61 [Vibrio phage 1.111.B._10N.286.45.E6]|nr:hypothetical protein NVP1111A_61 [Vibrio phage 1.111.A._10N.286.45.E6]AUR88317.1 hypothetical protein NVP1111B_61 [Vibrio phage 1.111.B._10N.286.45.E6]
MSKKNIIRTKHTSLKSVRLPHWLIDIVYKNDNASKEIVELMELGVISKHGMDFVNEAKSK